MLRLLRRLLPRPVRSVYHRVLALSAALLFRYPSRNLIVVGVTGTTGKSSVANWIAYLLREQGHAVGVSSTPLVAVGADVRANTAKMTMPGRFALQRLLRRMVTAGCRYAILEMTSEGIAQHRALGVEVDVAVFTNLAPEHLESHGSFRSYRASKGKLFTKLRGRRKVIAGQRVPKVAVVNGDDPQANYFLFQAGAADQTVLFTMGARETVEWPAETTLLAADHVRLEAGRMRFRVARLAFQLPTPAPFAVPNALAAIAVGVSQGLSLAAMRTLLANAPTVPGRLERVEVGQPFTVVVDYAHEPVSLAACYVAVRNWRPRRLIGVLGATGGGRDRWKRPVLGRLAAEHCDLVIVTTDDPYDEDPERIIEQIASGAEAAGKVRGRDLLTAVDRREGIGLALAAARPKDAVVITGKGSEPWLVLKGGKKIPWDDREVVRELLAGSRQ